MSNCIVGIRIRDMKVKYSATTKYDLKDSLRDIKDADLVAVIVPVELAREKLGKTVTFEELGIQQEKSCE